MSANTIQKTSTLIAAAAILSLSPFKPAAAATFPIANSPDLVEIGGGSLFDGQDYTVGIVAGNQVNLQRVASIGFPYGPSIQIGFNPGFPPAVAVAAAKTNALVAWSDYSISSGLSIFGQLVSLSGAKIGPAFSLLTAPGAHDFQITEAAASDGTNFLVTWRDAANNDLYGQLVSPSGALSGTEFLLASLGNDGEKLVTLTRGKNHYLLAWQSGSDTSHHTYARLISFTGSPGPVLTLSQTPSLDRNPLAAAFDGSNFLVVWNRDTEQTPGGIPVWKLCGRFVSDSGAVLGNELVLVDEEASFPALAFDGFQYLLAWGHNTGTTNTDVNIYATFIDRLGNKTGSILTPFTPIGDYPPLLPINGLLFDGQRFLLTATFGAFVLDGAGDVIGFDGGDLFGTFIPRSGSPPAFTNISLTAGNFHAQLTTSPGQSYTIQISTNLVDWSSVAVFTADSDLLDLTDPDPVSTSPRLFYRAALGNIMPPTFGLFFLHFADAGSFAASTTPNVSFPRSITGYSVGFDVENDPAPPQPSDVYLTGPAGSGLSNTPADPINSNIGTLEASYQSPMISSPTTAPAGTWTVNYHATNHTFTMPDPQAASRLVIPVPTVQLSGDLLQTVNWVYKNPATGATLPGAPSYITDVQVQIDDASGRIYDSPELTPSVTSHPLPSPLSWSTVRNLFLAYNDTMGNHYVVMYSKP